MALIETHDETKPAGSRARSLGDDDIREKDRAIRERLAVDHESEADETGNDNIGYHKQVTLIEAEDIGVGDTGLPIVGAQTVDGKPELVFTDEDNNDVEITEDGKVKTTDTVKLTGDQTVAGIKTFSSSPIVPTPTTDMQAATKKYGDDTFPPKAAVNSRVAALAADIAVGTNDINAPVAEDDMANMSITMTTVGTKLDISFCAPFRTTSNRAMNLVINIDGVNKVTYVDIAEILDSSYTGPMNIPMIWLEKNLTPGEHTVKIRWSSNNTSNQIKQRGATDGPRVLIVRDLD